MEDKKFIYFDSLTDLFYTIVPLQKIFLHFWHESATVVYTDKIQRNNKKQHNAGACIY